MNKMTDKTVAKLSHLLTMAVIKLNPELIEIIMHAIKCVKRCGEMDK